jgi:hypothetical protein
VRTQELRAAGLLAALAAVAAGGCEKMAWQDYADPGGNCSVTLPGAPKLQTRNEPDPDGGMVTMKVASVNLRDSAWMVSFTDFPPASAYDFDEGIQSMVDRGKGKLLDKKEVKLGELTGREFTFEVSTPQTGTAVCRIFFSGNRLYQAMVLGSNVDPGSPDVQKFIGSFKILK